ncbi:unnamed protein product [Ilex paraguariensis]|uniref:Uncharacterized protein n=1 Tax=Ilex paraguariensis TaxID=185542 RepID=A0ABC8R8C6_9AQUA
MYVLCFRMRSMVIVPRLKSQLLLMGIEEILRHPLNALRVCLPSIVEEFLGQAKAARLFSFSETFVLDGLLESELSRAFGGVERLDMFFPFDPCLLKMSDRFIRPIFIYWSLVRPNYFGGEDDELSSDEDVAEDRFYRNKMNVEGGITGTSFDEDDGIGRSFEEDDPDLDEFDYSLNKMSITPKNSLNYTFEGQLQRRMQMPSRIRPSTSPESL